jgi:hypothetical protein
MANATAFLRTDDACSFQDAEVLNYGCEGDGKRCVEF